MAVAAAVSYPGDPPIPASLAEVLAANCAVTVSATGAQALTRHCLRYDRSGHRFSYRWRLGRRTAGTVTVTLQLQYRG